MDEKYFTYEFPQFNDAVRKTWDTNANFWNERMGEGNSFHNTLIKPTQEKLLNLKPGETILDIGCGNGQFARQMAKLHVNITGVDISENQIKNAIAASADYKNQIRFKVVDATDESEMCKLGKQRFDAITCNMVIMDMAEIKPLASSVSNLLKPGGRFVFTIAHPVFNSPKGLTKVIERFEHENGEIEDILAIKIPQYMKSSQYQGIAIVGQPVPQHLFHRPISVLLNVFFEAGFVADRVEEPVFESSSTEDPLTWDNFNEIPPVMSVRFRLVQST